MTGADARASHAHVGLALAALAPLAACGVARAAQWSIEPQFGLLVNYNSNLLLAPTGELASEGTTLSVDATLKRDTGSMEMDLHPHLDLQRFANDPTLNANNGSLQGSYSTHSERSTFSLGAGYEKASTLVTELSSTGIIDANTRRETTSASVSLGRDFSETQHLDLQGTYANVVYPDGEQAGLVGYRYPVVSLTDTFTVSPRTSWSVGAQADQLKVPQTDYLANDQGLRLTLKHSFSALTSVAMAAGGTNTTVAGTSQHGYVWDLHGTHNSLLTQWDVDISQTLQPSGRGYLVRRNSVSVSASQNVAPRLYATMNLQFVRNSEVAGGPFLDVPRYFSGDAGFDYHVAEHIVVSVTGGYTELEEPGSYQHARGWRAGVNTRWTPVPLTTSR